MPSPHGYVETLAELSAAGLPFVSVSLVEASGSTPQDVGAKMLVDTDGLVYGTVGGGRVENKAIEHAQMVLSDQQSLASQLVDWNLQRDVGMTCGGIVKLYFESYNLRDWQIVIFGAGHVAQALVRCLLLLECRITCIDPRDEWLAKLPDSAKLEVFQREPASYIAQLTGNEYLVSMTMGHRSDLPVLDAIFRRELNFPYVGVIGSAAKKKVLVRELVEAGFDESQVKEAFRCPVGLDLGTNQPGEIAVSIAAEMIKVRDQTVSSC
ncbi:MAG: xanthine dehydrogenase accessory protein XdhC [Aeoliella sp.]